MKAEKMTRYILKIFTVLLFAVIIVKSSIAVHSEENMQILNNGTDGIYIDINGAQYKRLQQIPTWGENAYTEYGCAWFATARVSELTGIEIPTIYGAGSWYNSVYSYYEGFEKGNAELKRAKALACYSGYNAEGEKVEHIAVVEKISDDGEQVLISEGGNPDAGAEHGYTVLRWVDCDEMTQTGSGLKLLGYVYLPDYVGGTCGKEDSNLTWKLSGGTLTISGTGEMASWDMASPWYEYRDEIQKVVVNPGVTTIGKWAFYECKPLAEVTIADSVQKIGAYAFSYCEGLTELNIPDSVIEIGGFAFSYCRALQEINIPTGIKEIAKGLFAGCTSLSAVVIPENITAIQDQSFDGCTGLARIVFKGNAPDFGSNVFSGVIAFIEYPYADDSWTSGLMQMYGGNVVWDADTVEDIQGEVGNPVIPQSASQDWQGSYVYFGEYQLKKVESEGLLKVLKETVFDENNSAVVDGVRYYKVMGDYDADYYESVPVRWQVLNTDDGAMLLLSEKLLNVHPFDERTSGANDIKWANSELRRWLAEDFYDSCFDENEKAAVLETTLSNATGGELDGGPETTDKVFLLSAQEMTNTKWGFWGTNDESASRRARLLPGVSIKLTTWTSSFNKKYVYNEETETGYYWTRTPYNVRYGFALSPMFTAANGEIGYANFVLQTWNLGIRPAMRISTDSDQWKTELQVKGLYLSEEQLVLDPGTSEQLTATVMPSEYVPDDVIWKSSDPDVAEVDQDGNVTGVSEGTAEISALTYNGITKTCTVTVGSAVDVGDINGDSEVDLNDLMMCLRHVSGEEPLKDSAYQAADITGDGNVDLSDLMRLLRYISGESEEI